MVKIRMLTTACDYLAHAGPPKAVGLSGHAQNLWFRLMLMGGRVQRLDDGYGVEVFGKASRIDALAESMGTSPATVRRAMAQLVEAGVLIRRRRVRGYQTLVLLPDQAVEGAAKAQTKATVSGSDGVVQEPSEGVESEPVHGVTAEPAHELTGEHELTIEPVHELTGEPVHGLTGEPPMIQSKVQSKVQSNHHQGAPQDSDASGDGGGGHAGLVQGDTEQAQRVRSVLGNAGVWTAKLDELTKAVVGMPDGPDRLDKTYERVRRGARDPAAVLSRLIREGSLDELSERESASRREQQELADAEHRFSEKLPEFCERMRLECGPYMTVPLAALVDRVAHGKRDSATDKAWSDFKAMSQSERRRWLLNHERASKRRLAGMDETTPELEGDADEDGVNEAFRASDAMRRVLQTVGD
jgi:biotin operon repressor